MESEIHIGKLIESVMNEQGRKAVWLAKQINCSRTNVYKIFQKQSIDTDQLIQISKALNIDFFAYFSKYVLEQ